MSIVRHGLLVTGQEGEGAPIAGEFALLGTDALGTLPTPNPLEIGLIAAEWSLSGFVDPEVGTIAGEFALIGSEQLSGAAQTSRLVRKRATPVTWES